jgi:hypothetical protein
MLDGLDGILHIVGEALNALGNLSSAGSRGLRWQRASEMIGEIPALPIPEIRSHATRSLP